MVIIPPEVIGVGVAKQVGKAKQGYENVKRELGESLDEFKESATAGMKTLKLLALIGFSAWIISQIK